MAKKNTKKATAKTQNKQPAVVENVETESTENTPKRGRSAAQVPDGIVVKIIPVADTEIKIYQVHDDDGGLVFESTKLAEARKALRRQNGGASGRGRGLPSEERIERNQKVLDHWLSKYGTMIDKMAASPAKSEGIERELSTITAAIAEAREMLGSGDPNTEDKENEIEETEEENEIEETEEGLTLDEY